MEDLNEIIICSILNRLKIDAIATTSEQYSWADSDEYGKVSGGVDYFLELEALREKRNKLIKEILEEFEIPKHRIKFLGSNIRYSKVYQLQENEKHIKEAAFLGINSKNKTIEPISEKLDKNIKDLLPEKIYNFLIAKCLVDESHKNILNTNALDLILNYWKNTLPDIDAKDCWTNDGDSQYFWEVLFKENNRIIADFGGDFGANFYNHSKDLLKHDFWKVFVENYKETASSTAA